jgi:hypothetical protein
MSGDRAQRFVAFRGIEEEQHLIADAEEKMPVRLLGVHGQA